jgi:7,8-dihydroneopterin aldolase/epimerase/oxygenase
MDKITIKGMKVFGYHGIKPEEQANGQDFIIDVEMLLDLKKAGLSDNPDDSVDCCQVYSMVKHITKNNIFRLIEKLADTIAREILSRNEKIAEVLVRIMKPDAPLTGEFDSIGIEMSLSRKSL